MGNRRSKNHQKTTLVCKNLGTITDPKRKREVKYTAVTFTTFDMPDIGVDVIKRVAHSMKRQLILVHIQSGNGTMKIRLYAQDNDEVTNIINDFFDAMSNADAKVPTGMTSFPSPRQRPKRRVPTGRRRNG